MTPPEYPEKGLLRPGLHYVRTHIPTGRRWAADFSAVQHWAFSDNVGTQNDQRKAASALVSSWNMQQRHTWHYDLVVS